MCAFLLWLPETNDICLTQVFSKVLLLFTKLSVSLSLSVCLLLRIRSIADGLNTYECIA